VLIDSDMAGRGRCCWPRWRRRAPGRRSRPRRQRRVTDGVLHPGAVLEAARWFGLPARAALHRLPDCSGLVVPIRDLPQVTGTPRMIRAACRDRGIARLPDILQAVPLDRHLVERLVDHDPRLRRRGGELWLVPESGRNVVRCTVRRMLAFGPQTVDDLLAGIRASMYGRPIPQESPSGEALRAYLGDQPNYLVRGDVARRRRGVRPEPAGTDAVIVAAFREARRRLLTTAQLRQALTSHGYSTPGLAHLIRTTPMLRRIEYGRYELRPARS